MKINPVRIPMQHTAAPQFGAAKTQSSVSDRFIDVSGVGTVSKEPNVVRLTVNLVEQQPGKNGRAAVTKNLNEKALAMRQAIEALKLPLKLQSSFSVNRWTEWEDNKNKFKGFTGQYSLTIAAEKKPLAELKDIVAKLTDLSVQKDFDFGEPQWDFSDRKSAAVEAIQDAALSIGETVAALAKAFGLKVSATPAQLSLGGSSNFGHAKAARAMASMESADGGMSAEVMEAANIPISSPQVNARYEIQGIAPTKKA